MGHRKHIKVVNLRIDISEFCRDGLIAAAEERLRRSLPDDVDSQELIVASNNLITEWLQTGLEQLLAESELKWEAERKERELRRQVEEARAAIEVGEEAKERLRALLSEGDADPLINPSAAERELA